MLDDVTVYSSRSVPDIRPGRASQARCVDSHRSAVTNFCRALAGLLYAPTLLVVGCTDLATGPIGASNWGGIGIALEITAAGATFEFDCAHGSITAPIVVAGGRFAITGVYVQEHGGPVQEGEAEDVRVAEYSGVVRDESMTLTITLSPDSSLRGPFQLRRNHLPQVHKCL